MGSRLRAGEAFGQSAQVWRRRPRPQVVCHHVLARRWLSTTPVHRNAAPATATECEACEPPRPGSVDPHVAHVFLVTPSKTNWTKDLADDSEVARKLLASFKNSTGPGIKLTATDDSLQTQGASGPDAFTLLIFPARLAVSAKLTDINAIVPVLREHYQASLDSAAAAAYQVYQAPRKWQNDQLILLGRLTNARERSSTMTVEPMSNTVRHLFVCTHGNRDSRCGRAGQTILPALRTFAERATAVPIHVHATSHIGGHKQAGNVIDYGEGHWYGGINMQNLERWYTAIAEGRVLPEFWRGRVGLSEPSQLQMVEQLQTSGLVRLSQRLDSEISIKVTDKRGTHELKGLMNERLMTVLKRSSIDLEGSCGGNMECATCHVVLDEDWRDDCPPGSDAEQDMLDMLDHVQEGSRLSCQILLKPSLNGLRVTLPSVFVRGK